MNSITRNCWVHNLWWFGNSYKLSQGYNLYGGSNVVLSHHFSIIVSCGAQIAIPCFSLVGNEWLQAFPDLSLLLISSWMELGFSRVVLRYLNSVSNTKYKMKLCFLSSAVFHISEFGHRQTWCSCDIFCKMPCSLPSTDLCQLLWRLYIQFTGLSSLFVT
jgi:hypothetical protein